MTLSPARPKHAAPIDVSLLEVDAGVMIQARYGPHEYCPKCGASYLAINPDAQHRIISLYEVRTSWRVYRCGGCSQALWGTEERR